jgi:hypothetical protein
MTVEKHHGRPCATVSDADHDVAEIDVLEREAVEH